MSKSFKDTLNLPHTDFSMRANAKTKEPELLARWQQEKLYDNACKKNEKKGESFVLHDGPPFVNGHMHMGHGLNRTLKDIVCKSRRMTGCHVISIPGWDCHGLPIELKVAKELGVEKDPSAVDRVTFKKKCREYAQHWIDVQEEEIKRLGVVTDWDHPYVTMSPGYEASILKCFAVFVEKGFIERKGKTVPWCASCQTVLATAEIEYKDKKDPSCFILFPFETDEAKKLFPDLFYNEPGLDISLLVWTTTPWTIPLNRAVIIHPKAPYVVLQGKEKNQAFIVGEKLADAVCQEIGIEKKILEKISPEQLQGKKVRHPYIQGLQVPVILDNMVLLEDGTACVHSAPGCGPEDYLLGVKNGLEIFSPLSPDGKYTKGIQPPELEGMSVFDGQGWSMTKMHEAGRLLHKGSLTHAYPHCWRCYAPLIFRATEQWFCDLKKDDLINRAINAANELTFIPDWGKIRLTSSMASRTEWCLSRQRQWGVPIPAVLCNNCNKPYLEPAFIRAVAEYVAQDGIEYWDTVTIDELAQKGILPKKFTCSSCGNNTLKNFRKEMDIVDVWFESGVSHTAVKDQHPALKIPADVYLEASDQHRGWFQSSLLSSMIMYDKTCTKTFITHPFVLDASAEKMSKSKGNVIYPQELIEQCSADILRLWFTGCDFETDILVTEEQLKNTSEVYKKIRNTCRFMISNLYDFDIEKDFISISDLPVLDQYALAKLQETIKTVKSAYDEYWFTNVFHTLNRYCTNDLSSFYLDIIKDRLYVEKANGYLRRSAQTVMFHILDALTRLMAPVLSFLAEEVADFYQKNKKESIHLQDFPRAFDIWEMVKQKQIPSYQIAGQEGLVRETAEQATLGACMTGWGNLLEHIRPELLKAIELQREKGVVKHSLEAKVIIYLDESNEYARAVKAFINYIAQQEHNARFFQDFIVVSQVLFVDSPKGLHQTGLPWLYVNVEHADGVKCPRCWQWEVTDHPDELCKRCANVVEGNR